MWVAKLFPYRRLNTHFSSGGLGAMGFAVPAAIGVHLARPGNRCGPSRATAASR